LPLIQQLLVDRIDPPTWYRQRWFDDDAEAFALLTHPSSLERYPRLFAQTKELLGENASLWAMTNWAMALLELCLDGEWDGRTPLPQNAALPTLARALGQEHAADDAALYGRLLVGVEPNMRERTWQHVNDLKQQLPLCPLFQLFDVCWGLEEQALVDLTHYAKSVVPTWASGDQAKSLLDVLAQNLTVLNQNVVQVFTHYNRPELSVAKRTELLEAVILWHKSQHEEEFLKKLSQAQAFISRQKISATLTATVLLALRFPPTGHPNMRPALETLLASAVDDGRKEACIHILMQVDDVIRPRIVQAVFKEHQRSSVRSEDPESAMQMGRIRASDHIVAQVVDRVPRTSHWRNTLSQIAAYISAAKIDPATDLLLLDSTRTGVSELDNALYTLQGPTQTSDATDALIHNPVYALIGQNRVVGLGHVAASLWQLLRDSPADAPTLQKQRQDRQYARTNYILALARSVESPGRRVCGWGLSERLTEACTGYIKGIEQTSIVYPGPLLRQLADAFAKSDQNHSRADQERFFHDAMAQAQTMLFSPEAIEDFATQLLEYMRLDYDWPQH